MVCPNCKKEMTPQVTITPGSGMHNRICPECGENVSSLWDQDVQQIRVKTKWGFLVLVPILIIFGAVAFWLTK